jgi:hypothetical protein
MPSPTPTFYAADMAAGSLMLPESRRIASLLLTHPSDAAWAAALSGENLLQKKPATARRLARLIRNRLETLDEEGMLMVADAQAELAGQVLLAAAIRQSRLLADFLRDVYAAEWRSLGRRLKPLAWDGFLAECAHRDAAVAQWATTTRAKLLQVIVRLLAEVRFLDSTRTLRLTPPLLHPGLRGYLTRLGDLQTLALMDLHE